MQPETPNLPHKLKIIESLTNLLDSMMAPSLFKQLSCLLLCLSHHGVTSEELEQGICDILLTYTLAQVTSRIQGLKITR